MSPRPPLQPGTSGTVRRRTSRAGTPEAYCLYRDWDGRTRQIAATGKTPAQAERNLRERIRERQGPGGHLTADTKLSDLADAWLAEPHDWADGTRQTYTAILRSAVRPALGRVSIGEARVPVLDRALQRIAAAHGPSAAKTAKSILSGMLGYATRQGVIDSNPTRDTSRVRVPKHRPRALTPDDIDALTDALRADPVAIAYDLPDLVDWMLGTGCRIGEALAAGHANCPGRDPHQSLDLDAGTWEVDATVKRITGRGVFVQHRTKSDAGWRVLALPSHLILLIEKRRYGITRLNWPNGILFGSPNRDTLRDVESVDKALRRALNAAGYSWSRSHTFRKTVATRLDAAGMSPKVIADQMGHARPSMTLDVYLGRNVVSADAARILDR